MRSATRQVLYVILSLVAGLTPMALRAETIVVYGASGPIGGLIVSEALSRGDTVIGVSRDTSKLKFDNKNFRAVAGDVTDLTSFKSITAGVDAVIISVGGIPFQPGSVPYAMILGHLDELQTYRASKIRWTVLTPPLKIEGHNIDAPPVPKRTGKYRTSTTGFVTDANGESRVDIADLAVAAVDEAEHPRFVGKRFTVGY